MLDEEPLFQWWSNGSQLVVHKHPMNGSLWSSTSKEASQSYLTLKKTDITGNPHDTPSKEEDDNSIQDTVVLEKGQSAYEKMIQSLEEQTRSKDNNHTKDCSAGQGPVLMMM